MGLGLGPCQRRQQQAGQNRDDRDDDEQFDQGERVQGVQPWRSSELIGPAMEPRVRIFGALHYRCSSGEAPGQSNPAIAMTTRSSMSVKPIGCVKRCAVCIVSDWCMESLLSFFRMHWDHEPTP